MVLLLAYGGLRIGEALPLRRRHLDVEGNRVVVAEAVSELPVGPVIDTPKNHQRRELSVPAFVVKVVREYLATLPDDPDAFVFPGRQQHTAHRQQSYHGFRRRFRHAVIAAGLADATPHDRRVTHASWVADSHGVLAVAEGVKTRPALTFLRLEEIIGAPLPPSARYDRTWWGNTINRTRVQAHAWLNAIWKVDAVDLDRGTVTFVPRPAVVAGLEWLGSVGGVDRGPIRFRGAVPVATPRIECGAGQGCRR